MKKTLTVHVTEADIRAGVRGAEDSCPIALALNREYPECGPWSVNGDGSATGKAGAALTLPFQADQFVDDFDSGRAVEPFKFRAKPE